MSVNVFITVDTEPSIGGAFLDRTLKPVGKEKRIYGRVDGKEYGIPLMMDIADRHGLAMTFFVEVLNRHYFGEQESRDVCTYISQRGHDVQLHLHPAWLNFGEPDPSSKAYSDNMWDYSVEAQAALIGEGKRLLADYSGRPPVAFRAGNYAADQNTLRALRMNGIRYDTSYNRAVQPRTGRISQADLNDAQEMEGVAEFPVTNFMEHLPFLRPRFKALDLSAVGFREVKTVLEAARRQDGPRNITLVLHSFTFLQHRDFQYRACGIRRHVVRRFEKLCRYLRRHSDHFNTRSVSDALAQSATTGLHLFCDVPCTRSVLRRTAQYVADALCASALARSR